MMWRPMRLMGLVFVAFSLIGCGIGRTVTSPFRYVFHSPEPAPASNTSDVAHPGRPLPVPSATPRAASRKSIKPSPSASQKPTTKKTAPTAAKPQFPVAKPVPGKPGLVFNPFKPNGGYIDVSGYAPGSKVKDPESQKIFIVP